jgi:hypothetical protein
MTNFGFSLICEEHHPTELVANAQRAEAAGFDLLTSRTCSTPWHGSHSHCPCAGAFSEHSRGHQLG